MCGEAEPTLVTGQLIIGAAVAPFHGATAHLRLEDISYADADAVVVAETILPNVTHDPSKARGRDTVIPFVLKASPSAPAVSQRNSYAVRAWVDRDSDGTASAGDLFSDQSYRVLTQGFGSAVTITLGSP